MALQDCPLFKHYVIGVLLVCCGARNPTQLTISPIPPLEPSTPLIFPLKPCDITATKSTDVLSANCLVIVLAILSDYRTMSTA